MQNVQYQYIIYIGNYNLERGVSASIPLFASYFVNDDIRLLLLLTSNVSQDF